MKESIDFCVKIPNANNKNPTCEIELKASNLFTFICDKPTTVPMTKESNELINNKFCCTACIEISINSNTNG